MADQRVQPGAERHFGVARENAIGRLLWDVVPASYDSDLARRFRSVMEGGEPVVIEAASIVLTERSIEGRLFPLAGGMGVAFRDVTERKRAEIALKRREAELARVQRIAGVGGLEVDLRDGFVNRRSPEYLRLHGLPDDAASESHQAWVDRIHPNDRVRAEADFKQAVEGHALAYVAEYRIHRPNDGDQRWIEAWAEIERDETGKAVHLVGAHRDITDRKRAETQRELLINELNHRVKNTLATVQSIAVQSLKGAPDKDAAWAAFEGRLLALSRAHDLLTRENWDGAELRDVVVDVARPFDGEDGGRIRIEGDAVRLSPRTALAIAMALQELATNAAKYGALSVAAGRVQIAWTTEDHDGERRLLLTWSESGGPPVTEPKSRGFGSRLIEKGLPRELEGEVKLVFDPLGVICSLKTQLTEQ